jgi:acetyltransferase-like isoleucine patch superfamily enzyme
MRLSIFARGTRRLIGKIRDTLRDCYDPEALANRSAVRRIIGECGEGVEMQPGVTVTTGARLSIGDYVFVNTGCRLHAEGGIKIEDHAILGPDILIMSSMHAHKEARLLPYDERELLRPVEIGRACWLGARCIVMPGVKLGEGCIVGSGAVVTRSFPAGTIVAGNPARQIAERDGAHWKALAEEGAFYLRTKQREHLQKREVAP